MEETVLLQSKQSNTITNGIVNDAHPVETSKSINISINWTSGGKIQKDMIKQQQNKKTKIKYTSFKINGLDIDKFLLENPQHCSTKNNDKILIFDSIPLSSVDELAMIAIRIFELCEFVDLFIIMEQMYYPNGEKKESLIWNEKEKHLNLDKLLMLSKCNGTKIVHYPNYKNVYVEGYNVGLRGERLQRIYFDHIRRNLQIALVFENCFKYFGDNNCNLNNMQNVYIILSDTDEIPRNNVLKLLKRCDSNIIQKPGLTVTIRWQAYDFGCHLGKSEDRRVKIISLKYMSPDITYQNGTAYRESPYSFQQKHHIENITVIDNGGWHLTYWGNSTQIVQKNKHKAHLFFRRGTWINPIYQKCQYEICSYYVHGRHAYRVPVVHKNDTYYPLIVSKNLSNEELSQISLSLKRSIDVDPILYQRWLTYWNYNTTHNVDSQKSYCKICGNTSCYTY